ncbi:MAG: histone deacetylase family protein [Alphaproteobacteria bacterium]|jgi:acetoin utilization deacetylase AcuC-like enzyme|nr:histone deacetylase family protein [Alphaproteobacteria bacterium]
MARTALYTHAICVEHEPGQGHPECPDRLRSINQHLAVERFDALDRHEAPMSDATVLKNVHNAELVDTILANVPAQGYAAIDGDTLMSPASGEAALRAVGGICAAVDTVIAGDADNAFCAVRPPGHHAEPDRAMGFCLFNNVVLGADHARRQHGLTRVAVVDFDVHHGNGTQAAFEADGDLLFASTHQFPLYPGTGDVGEIGVGNIWNAPLRPMAGSNEFRDAMTNRILPAVRAHKPELIIISAGFDAHRDDPLAALQLVEADYKWVTTEIANIAAESCSGRLVSSLEGGYNIDALGRSTAEHVAALMAA